MNVDLTNDVSYELWDMTIPELSPRSTLYNLPPVGVGTVDVESLTGYISRLAGEHLVSPVVLLKNSVRDLSELPRTILQNSISAGLAGGLNGFGSATRNIVRILKNATFREDIHRTTLLPFEGVLSNHKLLKKHLAWCSACFEDRRADRGIVYEKLVWTLYDSGICFDHELPLADTCPHCRKKLKVLSGRSRPGFCSKCYGWLGLNLRDCGDPWKSSDEYERKQALWKAGEIRKLLLKFPYLRIGVNRFIENLNRLIGTTAQGSINNFARETGIWHVSVRRLLAGSVLPTVGTILKLCQGLNVSPISLFGSRSENDEPCAIGEPIVTDEQTATHESVPETSDRQSGKDLMRCRLKIFLTETPPPSANEISRRTFWSTERLKRNFPDEYKRIVERYSGHARRGVPKISDDAVERILSEASTRKIPPSPQSVFREIGCTNTGYRYYRLFPKLCSAISARYKKANLKKFDVSKATKILHSALAEHPPPSYSEVARRIGCTRENLKKKIPDLSNLVNQRYKDHIISFREENDRRLREEIRKIMFKLQMNDSPVSMNKVRKLLPRKWNDAKFKAAYALVAAEMSSTAKS